MKKTNVIPLFWIMTTGVAAASSVEAQAVPPGAEDEIAIRQVALDYVQGALTGDATRVAGAVHEELNKVQVATLPQTGRQLLFYNTLTTLLSFVRGDAAQQFADTDKAVEITVFDVGNGIAAARAVGVPWYDLLQLAKIEGRWRIVDVLWAPRQVDAENRTDDPSTRSEVESAALGFIEGLYSGEAARLGGVLLPEVHKVMLQHHPETGEPFLYRMGWSSLMEVAEAGLFALPAEERKIVVDVQDICQDMASVKVTSARFIDLVQMARVNGEWKVINNLWVANPDAPPFGG